MTKPSVSAIDFLHETFYVVLNLKSNCFMREWYYYLDTQPPYSLNKEVFSVNFY